MILARREILAEIKKGRLKITPFEKEKVGECSVDLRLGKEFRKLKKMKEFRISEDYGRLKEKTIEIKLKEKEELKLKPGELILGITEETIRMPENLCGWIQGRSRFARVGLMVHVSSSLIQPGVENKQVLEIVNLSQDVLILTPGLKICQVIFEKLTSKAKHRGLFSNQSNP